LTIGLSVGGSRSANILKLTLLVAGALSLGLAVGRCNSIVLGYLAAGQLTVTAEPLVLIGSLMMSGIFLVWLGTALNEDNGTQHSIQNTSTKGSCESQVVDISWTFSEGQEQLLESLRDLSETLRSSSKADLIAQTLSTRRKGQSLEFCSRCGAAERWDEAHAPWCVHSWPLIDLEDEPIKHRQIRKELIVEVFEILESARNAIHSVNFSELARLRAADEFVAQAQNYLSGAESGRDLPRASRPYNRVWREVGGKV
jgi:hypothetical protein